MHHYLCISLHDGRKTTITSFQNLYHSSFSRHIYIFFLDTDIPDEFLRKTQSELQSICSSLKNSRVYRRVPLSVPFPRPIKLEKISVSNDGMKMETLPEYTLRPLVSLLGEKFGDIAVFPCQTHESRTYWLTYGYAQSSIFLLKEVDYGKAVSFVGKSAPVPQIDGKYPTEETLNAYFWAALESKRNTHTVIMSLFSINNKFL